MFDGVARRYDLTNTVLSFGRDRSWRRRTRQCLQLQRGARVLDLAAGTGVSTVELARGGTGESDLHPGDAGAEAVARDVSPGVVRLVAAFSAQVSFGTAASLLDQANPAIALSARQIETTASTPP